MVKLSRPPIPVGDPDALSRAVSLSERAPWSGMEYGYYHGALDPSFAPGLSVDVLYPGCLADESEEARAKLLKKHIGRNTAQAPVAFRETVEAYENAHVPYMRAIPEGAIGWVYKILALEKETERLLFNDPAQETGFLLNTDPKWTTHPDHKTTHKAEWNGHASTRDLYCLGLCHRRDVRSLRDLRGEHLPMLRAMAETGRRVKRAAGNRWKISPTVCASSRSCRTKPSVIYKAKPLAINLAAKAQRGAIIPAKTGHLPKAVYLSNKSNWSARWSGKGAICPAPAPRQGRRPAGRSMRPQRPWIKPLKICAPEIFQAHWTINRTPLTRCAKPCAAWAKRWRSRPPPDRAPPPMTAAPRGNRESHRRAILWGAMLGAMVSWAQASKWCRRKNCVCVRKN